MTITTMAHSSPDPGSGSWWCLSPEMRVMMSILTTMTPDQASSPSSDLSLDQGSLFYFILHGDHITSGFLKQQQAQMTTIASSAPSLRTASRASGTMLTMSRTGRMRLSLTMSLMKMVWMRSLRIRLGQRKGWTSYS